MPLLKGPVKRCLLMVVILGILINSLAFAVWAVNPNDSINLPDYTEPETTALPSMAGLFIKIILSLGIIIFLTYGVMRVLQKQFKTTGGSWINVVDQVSLGPNRGLFIANIAGKIVALGVTDHQIVKILEIDDPDMIEQIKKTPDDRLVQGRHDQETQPAKTVDRFHYLIQGNLSRIRTLLEEKKLD